MSKLFSESGSETCFAESKRLMLRYITAAARLQSGKNNPIGLNALLIISKMSGVG